VIFTTFGDMMRVPGGRGSLLEAKARGADVRMVYSPLDALELARREPRPRGGLLRDRLRDDRARDRADAAASAGRGHPNFSAFCNHVTIGPPLKAILDSPGLQLDGFIAPGHVSTVIGTRPYDFIVARLRQAGRRHGFEPLDILHAS
jgi:hydrogenase expression/formation protein HypD